MREDDILRMQWIADPQISPDGTRIAFTCVTVDAEADEYRTNLWLQRVPAPGVSPAAPQQLTFSGRDAQPRWSPDGAALAFVRKPESGSGSDAPKPGAQIHVLPLAGGEAHALTSLQGGASSPAWSPDGTRIAFLSGHNPALDTPDYKKPKHEPGRVVTKVEFRWNAEGFTDWDHLDHIWVIPAAGGEPRQLTTGTSFKEGAPQWTADGSHVVYATDRRAEPWFGTPLEDNDVRAVPADLAAPVDGEGSLLVADIAGPLAPFVLGPGGRIAAVGGVRPAVENSYTQNDLLLLEGAWPMRQPMALTTGADLAVGEGVGGDMHPPRGGGAQPLAFASDGRVFFSHTKHGTGHLAIADPASGDTLDLTPAGLDVVCGTAAADRVALVIGTPGSPGDLYVYDLGARTLTRLYGPNEECFARSKPCDVEMFWYPSFDGRQIQGWLVKPPGFDPARKYPLILQIHGGPHAAYGFGMYHEFQVLAEAGYLVLYTNPRGSTSYGQEFANIIQFKYPGDDYHDLMAGVDRVIARGCVDESRMGVTGGSGGGLLTNWIITKTHRFKTAITQRCVSEWATMWYSCDFAMVRPTWFRGAPFEVPQDFAARSPATFIDQIQTPLMVLHSEEDWRTPIGQGEIMFRGLKKRGIPTVMVRFPGESHELSRSGMPARRVQNQQHIRRWFDHWLMDKPAPEYGVPSPGA